MVGLQVQKVQDLFDLPLNISVRLHIAVIDLGLGVKVGAGVVGLVVWYCQVGAGFIRISMLFEKVC